MSNLMDFWKQEIVPMQRWNPAREISSLQNQIDRLFSNFTSPVVNNGVSTLSMTTFTPSCDVNETDSHFLMNFDLPGMKKEDIKVEMRNNQIFVSGRRKEEHEEKDQSRYVKESLTGAFERSFTFPVEVKSDLIEANYVDGVLRIVIPKAEAAKAQAVKIGEGKPGLWDKLLGHKKDEMKKTEKVA